MEKYHVQKFCSVGHNVFVGDRTCCDNFHPDGFEKFIHIWRDDHPDNSCNAIQNNHYSGMELQYHDGESFTKANKSIEHIAEFCRGNDRLLVHCAAGQTRSPAVALIAKVARGCDVYGAIADITRACYDERDIVPNWCLHPMRETIWWAHGKEWRRE